MSFTNLQFQEMLARTQRNKAREHLDNHESNTILSSDHSGATPKLESNFGHEPLAAQKVQGSTGPRILIRVTSVRKRLLDEDNLCEKYHVDLCRNSGVVVGDAPDQIKIEVGQRKTNQGEAEHTTVEAMIFP